MYQLHSEFHQELLQIFFENEKERKAELLTPFGYLIYSELNSQNEKVYFVIGMSAWKFGEDFRAEAKVLASNEKEYQSLIQKKDYLYHFHHNYLGGDTVEFVQQTLGKLEADEVFFVENNYSLNPNPKEHIFKLKAEDYLQMIASYFKQKQIVADDFYDLDSSIDEDSKILKLYNSRMSSCLSCINLRVIASYGYGPPRTSFNENTWFTKGFGKLKDLVCLSLTNNFSLLPESLTCIQEFTQLVDLNLSDNHLQEVPEGLVKLKNLKRLTFDFNDFSTLNEFLDLEQVESLSLKNNAISSISEDIKCLKNLKILNLSGNQIAELPKELAELKNLKILNLSNNPLCVVPDWIDQFEHLEELHLTQTQLQSLPKSIAKLSNKTKLFLKKNPFQSLPKELLEFEKSQLDLEERNCAVFDAKIAKKLSKLPTGNVKFESDFKFKLMVIQRLMYEDELLLPKFDVYDFASNYKERTIDLDEIDYKIIPEVKAYFEALDIPLPLLWDIKELRASGGDEIYHQCIPHWDGEDDVFDVQSAADVIHFPNLKKITIMGNNKEVVKFLRDRKIKVSFQ